MDNILDGWSWEDMNETEMAIMYKVSHDFRQSLYAKLRESILKYATTAN